MHSDTVVYSKDELEAYLPTVWGFDAEPVGGAEAPGKDMPKAQTDPRAASNAWCASADVQRAWAKANLTKRQRQVIYLRYCWGDLMEDIGETLDIRKQSVSEHLDRGLHNMLKFLNGNRGLELITE